MRRQGNSFAEIAEALGRTERSVSQKYLKLVPATASPTKRKSAYSDIPMSEDMKVKLLGAVAKHKTAFWQAIARDVGRGVTGPQCESEWAEVIRNRK